MNKINSAKTNAHLLTQYKVEVIDGAGGFRHRLVHIESGRATEWAGYTSITMLDDVAACTGYFSGHHEDDLTPMPAADLLRMFSVGVPVVRSRTFLDVMQEALGDSLKLVQGEHDHAGSFLVVDGELTPAKLYRILRGNLSSHFAFPHGVSTRMVDVVAQEQIKFLFTPTPGEVGDLGMIELDPNEVSEVTFDVKLNRFYVTKEPQQTVNEVPATVPCLHADRTSQSVIEAGLGVKLVHDTERGFYKMLAQGDTALPTMEQVLEFIQKDECTAWQCPEPDCSNNDGCWYFSVACLEGGYAYTDMVSFDTKAFVFAL